MEKMSLREIQLFSLEILKDVHSFCVNNGIRYSLCGGTLIGAVRHSGFIPWDDDIDINMPRDDYDRFCRSYKSDKFKLISPDDKDSRITFARVCDTALTYRESSFSPWTSIDTGVWIDIFPMDGASDSFIRYRIDSNLVSFFYSLLASCRASHETFNRNMSIVYRSRLFMSKLFFIPRWSRYNLFVANMLKRIVLRLICRLKFGETGHWTQLSCPVYPRKEYHDMDGFDEFEPMLFEDTELLVFKGFHKYLTDIFGDYMTPPPIERRTSGHSQFQCFWL